MKRNIVYIFIYIVAVVLISISFIFLFRENKRLKIEINRQEDMVEVWKNHYFNIEDAFSILVKYDNMHIPSETSFRNEQGEVLLLNELVGKSKQKLVLRLSKHNCMNCILSFNSMLQDVLSDVSPDDIIYVTDYEEVGERKYYKELLGINSPIYVTQNLQIPIEQEEIFYAFLIDSEFVVHNLFVPVYNQDFLQKVYLQTIKKLLN